MYASKTPRDLNHDPEPYVCDRFHRHDQEEGEFLRATHDPRPEFDHVQHNEPNTVLTGLRTLMSGGVHRPTGDFYADAARYLTGGTHAMDNPIKPGMADHARRVLSRLARLEGGK